MTTAAVLAHLPKDKILSQMLTCRVQYGTRSLRKNMEKYVYDQETNGVHIFNVSHVYDKCFVAARVISSHCKRDMSQLLIVGTRNFCTTPALKFAQYTGATSQAGKWTPGTLTNQLTKCYREPSLLLVTDPQTDRQAILESMYSNIPVIALCDSDAVLSGIDIVVPCNTKGPHSVAFIMYLICNMTLALLSKDFVDAESNKPITMDHFIHVDQDSENDAETEKVHKNYQNPNDEHLGSLNGAQSHKPDNRQNKSDWEEAAQTELKEANNDWVQFSEGL